MTSIFNHLSGFIPTLHGWCSVAKAQHLASMVVAIHAKTSLEIGVFAGRSLFGLAYGHKHIGHGVAIGIDPWTNAAATEGYSGENREWWGTLDLEKVYKKFMQNVNLTGCQNVIQVARMRSDDYSPIPELDILHCDGQHSEQAIRDVQRFGPHVRVGGLVVLDDLTWVNDGVASVPVAAEWLEKNGFRSLCRVFHQYPDGNKDDYGVMQRIK